MYRAVVGCIARLLDYKVLWCISTGGGGATLRCKATFLYDFFAYF